MSSSDKSAALKKVAESFMICLQGYFQKTSGLVFSQEPELKERDLIEYRSRMRVFGLEKFDGLCYLTYVSFFANRQDQTAGKAAGTLILFLEDDSMEKFLKALGYRDFNDEDDESVLVQLNLFCKALMEEFKVELSKLGYRDLIVSEPAGFKNDVTAGVNFPYSQYKYYELIFYFWKKKVLVADMIMAPPV